VTVSKEFNYEWAEIMLKIKEFIKNFIEDDGVILKEGYAEAMATQQSQGEEYTGDNAELVVRIKDLINTYVKPAVEMDGGNIEFKSFEAGTVYVILQGSCSGCPSSTVTLKAGIEGMLTRMIPEVKSVEAEMG
jgi:NFU1 iron-sulfur cluster scaffold homolog, mitochondrial